MLLVLYWLAVDIPCFFRPRLLSLLHLRVGGQSVAISVSDVCIYLSARIFEKHVQISRYFLYITCGRGLALLWPQCNMLSTSGFVDDVMFSHNCAYIVARQQWSSTSDPSPPVGVTWTCRSLAANDLRRVKLVAATNVYRSRDVKLDGYT